MDMKMRIKIKTILTFCSHVGNRAGYKIDYIFVIGMYE